MVKEKQWQEFDFTKESIKIHVEWCPKDFTAYNKKVELYSSNDLFF